jgi:hypothetical protein
MDAIEWLQLWPWTWVLSPLSSLFIASFSSFTRNQFLSPSAVNNLAIFQGNLLYPPSIIYFAFFFSFRSRSNQERERGRWWCLVSRPSER